MYNGSTTPADFVAPVTTLGAVTMLPATGVNNITSIAIAVFVGLVVWAAIYVYKTRRATV